ncbi:MAG: hypothetical protein ACYDBQ_11515 [Thermoplasmatota archaeon]
MTFRTARVASTSVTPRASGSAMCCRSKSSCSMTSKSRKKSCPLFCVFTGRKCRKRSLSSATSFCMGPACAKKVVFVSSTGSASREARWPVR